MTKIFFLGLFLSLLIGFTSCEPQDSIIKFTENEEQEKSNIVLTAKLLSQNDNFITFIKANQTLTEGHLDWYFSISDEERINYDKTVAEAMENQKTVNLTPQHISVEEFNNFAAEQKLLFEKITKEYPQIENLHTKNIELFKKASNLVLDIDDELPKVQTGIQFIKNICFAGYNACSWSAYDSGGNIGDCYAGYIACLGPLAP